MENAKWERRQMSIPRIRKITRRRTHFRKILKKLGLCEHHSDESFGGNGIIKRRIIRNLLQILKGRLCPNQSSQRDIRILASSWGITLQYSTHLAIRTNDQSMILIIARFRLPSIQRSYCCEVFLRRTRSSIISRTLSSSAGEGPKTILIVLIMVKP